MAERKRRGPERARERRRELTPTQVARGTMLASEVASETKYRTSAARRVDLERLSRFPWARKSSREPARLPSQSQKSLHDRWKRSSLPSSPSCATMRGGRCPSPFWSPSARASAPVAAVAGNRDPRRPRGAAAVPWPSGLSDSVDPSVLGAAAGGALGYAVSYWIGRYFKDGVFAKSGRSARDPTSSRTVRISSTRYGAFGVFLGHFFGPVRAVIPVVAGHVREHARLPFRPPTS